VDEGVVIPGRGTRRVVDGRARSATCFRVIQPAVTSFVTIGL
jgi:hypothetical protein